MIIRNSSRSVAGFSLLEVLIAVVVLSFGLLALTALQSRIFQASAEAKAQTVALALAKGKIEDMRSFMSMAQYQGLTTGSDTSTQDGITYSRSWTVRRFAVPVGGTTFQQYGTLTGALPAAYAPNREFKTVELAVTWTDASGQSRSARMEDAISGIDPQDSARNQRTRSGRSRGPKVKIYDPGSEAGVIPIAVGDGTESAATNPKPIVAGPRQQRGRDPLRRHHLCGPFRWHAPRRRRAWKPRSSAASARWTQNPSSLCATARPTGTASATSSPRP